MACLWKRRSLGAAALLFALGCGGVELERLDGDPKTVDEYTQPTMRRVHPAVDGCQRFLAAVGRGDTLGAWNQLSFDTQKALSERGKAVGLKGIEVLQWRKLPIEAGGAKTMEGAPAFDPAELFALPGIQTLQLVATPADDRAVVQNVELAGAGGRKKTVVMRYEQYAWRIHNPSLIP